MRAYLRQRIVEVLKEKGYDGKVEVTFDKPKSAKHGDLATNLALNLATVLKRNPRAIAEEIVGALQLDKSRISEVSVAGPGFINFRYGREFLVDALRQILQQGDNYGRCDIGRGMKTQVEFVSANPTGPLSVGHGRQAVLGDTVANLLETTGHRVTREYYFNNAGRQMRILAQSVCSRYMNLIGKEYPFPEDGYQGEYIVDIAKIVREKCGDALSVDDHTIFKDIAEAVIFEDIKKTLARLDINFDVFYNENSLYETGKVEYVINELKSKDFAYEKDGALWFRSSQFGLEQDRVIVKSTGEPTYRLPDIAYHKDKFDRGFQLVVDIFGADHCDTYPDVLAGIKALGYDDSKVKVLIHQFVTLLKDGQPVRMSTRKATFVTLDELIDEVGPDVVRYFFLLRNMNSHLNFDIDLAKKQSEENPVYYVQYAHARICSILHYAEEKKVDLSGRLDLDALQTEEEMDLVKALIEFPDVVRGAAETFEPHRLPNYLQEVATRFHKFYHRGNVDPSFKVVSEDRELSKARIALCKATKTVLANGFRVLGISAPERM